MRFALVALTAAVAMADTPIAYDAEMNTGAMPDGWDYYNDYHLDADWLSSDARYSQIPVNWFVDGATDLWKVHKAEVWDTAVADAKIKYGELLATCEMGNDCRRGTKATLIDTFQSQVEAQLAVSKMDIEVAYNDLVVCAE